MMLKNKVSASLVAIILLAAGLFLLYCSNTNKTVFLDIAADEPITVNAGKQEEGIAVAVNSDKNYTVSLPSTLFYQTKTFQLENTNNENIQLKFYSRQKKDNDRPVESSVVIKKVTVNGKPYNYRKQTAWFERPYSVDAVMEKDKINLITVKYKTKFILRNLSVVKVVAGTLFILLSAIVFLYSWGADLIKILKSVWSLLLKSLKYVCLLFFENLKSFCLLLIKNSIKLCLLLINNLRKIWLFFESVGEWDVCAAKKYHDIDIVYRKTFWTVFIILNIVFLYYNVHFIWGNHDWFYAISGLWGIISGQSARFTVYLPNQLLGGRFLPLVNVSFALLGYSFTGILLAYYWKVQKTFFNYLAISLLIVLNPLVINWLYYGIDVISHLWLPSMLLLALILSEKKSLWAFLTAYLLLILGFGIYASAINTLATVILGKILLTYCFEEQSVKSLFQRFIRTFCCLALSLISFKVIVYFYIINGQVAGNNFRITMNLFGGSTANFFKLVTSSYDYLFSTLPFYDNTIVALIFSLSLFALFVLLYYLKKNHTLKLFSFCLIVLGICLLPLALNATEFLLGYRKNWARIRFFGYIFWAAFWGAAILKTKIVWAKNIFIILLIFLLPMNVYRLIDAQKLWKMEFDIEKRTIERIAERIEESDNYIPATSYKCFFFGFYSPAVVSFYNEQADTLDDFFMTRTSLEDWIFRYSMKYYSPKLKFKKSKAFYFINKNTVYITGEDLTKCCHELLPYEDLLKKSLRQWPEKNSVLVQDKYIFINFDNKVLEAFLKVLDEERLKLNDN